MNLIFFLKIAIGRSQTQAVVGERQSWDQSGYCPFSYFFFTYFLLVYSQNNKPMYPSPTFNQVCLTYLRPDMKPNGFHVFQTVDWQLKTPKC